MEKPGGQTSKYETFHRPAASTDSEIAIVAADQGGAIADWQLVEAGLRPRAIQYRLRCGRLHRVHRGVYAVGHAALEQKGRWWAAVLAGGPGAALSHRSAAKARSMARVEGRLIEISVTRSRVGHPGLIVHRPLALEPHDIGLVNGLPVTSVARTLIDLAGSLHGSGGRWAGSGAPAQLIYAVQQAVKMDTFDLKDVARSLQRSPRTKGVADLRAALDEVGDGTRVLRSGLERRFFAFCRDRSLPLPASNYVVLGMEVDACWPAERVIVELDTFGTHGDEAAFERDRRRDSELAAARWAVVRVTDRRLEREPDALEGDLKDLLGLARSA